MQGADRSYAKADGWAGDSAGAGRGGGSGEGRGELMGGNFFSSGCF